MQADNTMTSADTTVSAEVQTSRSTSDNVTTQDGLKIIQNCAGTSCTATIEMSSTNSASTKTKNEVDTPNQQDPTTPELLINEETTLIQAQFLLGRSTETASMTQYDALPTGDGRSKHEIKTLRAAEASVEMDNTGQGLLSEFSDDVPFALWCISFWATDELSFD